MSVAGGRKKAEGRNQPYGALQLRFGRLPQPSLPSACPPSFLSLWQSLILILCQPHPYVVDAPKGRGAGDDGEARGVTRRKADIRCAACMQRENSVIVCDACLAEAM